MSEIIKTTAGYSGTPLVKKLGIKTGMKVLLRHAPENFDEIVGELPDDVTLATAIGNGDFDFVHFFVRNSADLDAELEVLSRQIVPHGMIWVSWYKKASKIPTDVTEDVIRDLARAIGLVDVKVCAVDDIWSGLKLVIRKENR